MSVKNTKHHWHVFCAVVDNFGDIGVCWRFARQLVAEQGQQVCLWVDDLHSFQRICPEIDPLLASQQCRGVQVRHWSKPLPVLVVADMPDVVIEAFACTIPDDYLQLMVQKPVSPLWINMEYLSAEDWVSGCHALGSPQTRYKLHKYFFFPGFVPATGGVLCEQNLLVERDRFRQCPAQQQLFWQDLGMALPVANELRIAMFGYDQPLPELQALVEIWSRSSVPVTVCVAEGKLAGQLVEAIQNNKNHKGTPTFNQTNKNNNKKGHPLLLLQSGQLSVQVLPFLEQDQFDRLLWACDINFVRGEDSFVRAQWAGKPFVWHIYRQEKDAHLVKLDAFLALYQQGLSSTAAQALGQFWQAWNTSAGIAVAWPAFLEVRQNLQRHTESWLKNTQNVGDFTTNMMIFCQKYL